MRDKLDVFEILGAENKESEIRDQEQNFVSGPDFNDVLKLLADEGSEKRREPEFPKLTEKEAKLQKAEKSLIRILMKCLVAIAVVLLIFTFVLNAPKVVGTSMMPTLQSGDRLIVNLLAGKYEVGDIVVFDTGTGGSLVKRIVAGPGDVVAITPDGKLSVNETVVTEEYVYTKTNITDVTVIYPVIVDEDTYFVLGDNRENSRDSRNSDIGLVEKKDIKGKVMYSFRKL